jgi:hypothetical protein
VISRLGIEKTDVAAGIHAEGPKSLSI